MDGAGRGHGERADRVGIACRSGDIAGAEEFGRQRGGKRVTGCGGINRLHDEGGNQVAVFPVVHIAAACAELKNDIAHIGL